MNKPRLTLVGFGANLLMAHADVQRGRQALAALDFYVHADSFMNPTAELADVVLPVTSPFESEGLKIGFEVSPAAQSLVQLRRPVAQPRGEGRSDTEIVFDLACRLGFGAHFWDGDVDAGYRYQLEPSGVTLEQLRKNPAGVRVPLETRYRKFAEVDSGVLRGFGTPSGLVELYLWAREHDVEDNEPLFFSRQLAANGRRKAIDRVRAWQIVKAASARADIHVLALRESSHGRVGEPAPVHPHLFRHARVRAAELTIAERTAEALSARSLASSA